MTVPILVIGNVNVDLIMGPQEPWPTPGTEVILPAGDLRVGGAAGNTALALSALGTGHRRVANRGPAVFGDWLAAASPFPARSPTTRYVEPLSSGKTSAKSPPTSASSSAGR